MLKAKDFNIENKVVNFFCECPHCKENHYGEFVENYFDDNDHPVVTKDLEETCENCGEEFIVNPIPE